MKKNLKLATLGCAALLGGCAAAPASEPTYAPPPAPVANAAPPAAVAEPYLLAHWGHYYRGPY